MFRLWHQFTGSNHSTHTWSSMESSGEDAGCYPSSKGRMHLTSMWYWLQARETDKNMDAPWTADILGSLAAEFWLLQHSFPCGNPEGKNNPEWSHHPGLSSSTSVPKRKHLDADGNWLISIRSSFPPRSKHWHSGATATGGLLQTMWP